MSIIFNLQTLIKHYTNIKIREEKHKNFLKELNHIIYCILIVILLMLPQVSPLLSAHFHRVERETRFICETPVKSSLSMRRRARLVRCVRARMQICNFVAKHKRGPACRSSA